MGPGGARRVARAPDRALPLGPAHAVEVRELPCHLDFRNCPVTRWAIGPAQVTAEAVTHRGPTLGLRIEDAGTSLCYLPDHEPAIVGDIDQLEPQWLSGSSLARDADLLIHDCQYTDAEYPARLGWGHSAVSHTLRFARRVGARRLLLFHHDPYHTDDELDATLRGARADWAAPGRGPDELAMAAEGLEVTVEPTLVEALERHLAAALAARGCALVRGLLRRAEGLAQPAAEGTGRLARGVAAGAEHAVHARLGLGATGAAPGRRARAGRCRWRSRRR